MNFIPTNGTLHFYLQEWASFYVSAMVMCSKSEFFWFGEGALHSDTMTHEFVGFYLGTVSLSITQIIHSFTKYIHLEDCHFAITHIRNIHSI